MGKMRQVAIKVTLLEYDMEDFPTPTAPKEIFSGTQIYLGEDATPAIDAARFLAHSTGMDVTSLKGE